MRFGFLAKKKRFCFISRGCCCTLGLSNRPLACLVARLGPRPEPPRAHLTRLDCRLRPICQASLEPRLATDALHSTPQELSRPTQSGRRTAHLANPTRPDPSSPR